MLKLKNIKMGEGYFLNAETKKHKGGF